MKVDWKPLDDAILVHISSGAGNPRNVKELCDMAKSMSSRVEFGHLQVDRRMQALRKAGRILYTKRYGWEVV